MNKEPPRILLVGDELRSGCALASALHGLGYAAEHFSCAAEALASDRSTRSAVLFVAARRLLTDDQLRHARHLAPHSAIVVVCDSSSLDEIMVLLNDVIDDCLLEPITATKVRLSLARITRSRTHGQHSGAEDRLNLVGRQMVVLAHEGRNILQAAGNAVELLQISLEDRPQLTGLLDSLRDHQSRLLQLFDDVRDYASPLRLRPQSCDLGVCLRRVHGALSANGQSPQIELVEVDNHTDLQCSADPFRIEQVFRNLLQNALDVCPQPVRITARWSRVKLEQLAAVQVVLCDNGPGLSDQQRESIFQPFFTTKSRGTGLGMAIVKDIVDAHGGRIELGQKQPGGAEFILTIPMAH